MTVGLVLYQVKEVQVSMALEGTCRRVNGGPTTTWMLQIVE